MAKRPTRVAISIAFAGETTDVETAKAIFGALDRHGLTPQTVENMDDPAAVKSVQDFEAHWCVTGDTRDVNGAPLTLKFGPDWRRVNAPQGWASVSHRLGNIKGQVKLGRLAFDHVFSPRVDWKAAFVDLCHAADPVVATLDVFRRESRSTLGFVEAFPLPAKPKRERITKPIQVDDTPWGVLRGVPWGLWLGPLWDTARRDDLARAMMTTGGLYHLSDAVPADPDILIAQKTRLRAELPHLFDPDFRYRGLP